MKEKDQHIGSIKSESIQSQEILQKKLLKANLEIVDLKL